jgi:hypothetical protein
MHIPKTSGSSIRSGLTTALAPALTIDGFDLSLFGPYRDLKSLDDSMRRTIHVSPASLLPHADLVCGHFAFSTLRDAYPHARYLTLLREPRSRLLSHWLFWRQHTDRDLAGWGSWADQLRISRGPLANFLSDRSLACQTDNLAVRMLLWPHRLIPEDGFIDRTHDKRLLRAALSRLAQFDFADVVEDEGFVDRLGSWLGRRFYYGRENETRLIPPTFHSPLHDELTPAAVELLGERSRLDQCLWGSIAARQMLQGTVANLREQAFLANLARLSLLMAA